MVRERKREVEESGVVFSIVDYQFELDLFEDRCLSVKLHLFSCCREKRKLHWLLIPN